MADAQSGGPGPSWRIEYMDHFDHLGLGNLGLQGASRAPRPVAGILPIQRAPIDPAGIVGLHGGRDGLPTAARGTRGRNPLLARA